MSLASSVLSRFACAGPIRRGSNSHRIPWCAITSCASSATARSNSSSCAETPVTIFETLIEPGTCSPFGPMSREAVDLEQIVEEGDDLGGGGGHGGNVARGGRAREAGRGRARAGGRARRAGRRSADAEATPVEYSLA